MLNANLVLVTIRSFFFAAGTQTGPALVDVVVIQMESGDSWLLFVVVEAKAGNDHNSLLFF